ncbi:MAG: hypothetical protein U0401_16880 [Anaerolineae bacterium]
MAKAAAQNDNLFGGLPAAQRALTRPQLPESQVTQGLRDQAQTSAANTHPTRAGKTRMFSAVHWGVWPDKKVT